MVKRGRKEKHQYKIESGLNLVRRRKEKSSVRTKSLPDLKGNSPDRACAPLFSFTESYLQRAPFDLPKTINVLADYALSEV